VLALGAASQASLTRFHVFLEKLQVQLHGLSQDFVFFHRLVDPFMKFLLVLPRAKTVKHSTEQKGNLPPTHVLHIQRLSQLVDKASKLGFRRAGIIERVQLFYVD
jgi:hypothetical protein